MRQPPPFATTVIGSFPHRHGAALSDQLVETLDIPAWPQLPRRSFRESIYVQFSAPLPGAIEDPLSGKVCFDTSKDLTGPLETFYHHYLHENLDAFALDAGHAAGFFDLLTALQRRPGQWAKGQVMGPISFGLTVTDQNLRPILYDDLLYDTLLKNATLNARWQIRQLQRHRRDVIIFVDEPFMAAFGSSHVSLGRSQVLAALDEVFAAIQAEGALAGVHCCANTDWSVLLQSTVDILNLDAYTFVENLSLYPTELRAFLARGGRVAWGLIPNDDAVFAVSASELVERWQADMALIQRRAQARGVRLTVQMLAGASLMTPACGLGSTTEEVASRSLQLLEAVAGGLRTLYRG